MPTCQPCAVPDHQVGDCADAETAMCHHTCTCRHGIESDPAPYWTQHREHDTADPAEQTDEAPV